MLLTMVSFWRTYLNCISVVCIVVLTVIVTEASTARYLPDTSGINGQMTANLQIDHFFSMWLVFHNDEVKMSDEPFTIFAPLNSASNNDNSILKNPDDVKKLLLDHVVLGRIVNIKNLSESYNLTSVSGRTITIKNENNKHYANKATIIEPMIELPRGVVAIVDNYLFDNDYEENSPIADSLSDVLPVGLLSTINAHDDSAINKNDNSNATFVENIHQVLSFLKSGVRVFQHFLSKSNVTKLLSNSQEYTVLIPTDHAFQRWHPIDWGFYPFSVPEFTEDILVNHFLIGNLRQNDIKDGQEMKTLGGRILKFNKKPQLSVNGVTIVKGDTPVNGGNIMFINEVLFVSESVVSRLHQQHRDKETPPLLAFPWFGAQFLSHAFLALEHDARFSHITRFLNLADLAPHVSGTGYTFFVPIDEAFVNVGLDDMPDNYLSTGEGLHLLLNHFVKKRLYEKDLVDNATFTTLGNETIYVSNQNGNITLNDANIIESEVFVYNLGTMYYINKLLFPKPDTNFTTVLLPSTTSFSSTFAPTTAPESESLPEEVAEEGGMLPDVLLESSTDDEIEFHTYSTLNNSGDPIK